MLGFFPQLYKDELLYSAFARFHQRSSSVSIKDTIFNLYENISTSAITDFPSSLEIIGRKINQEPNSIISKHTLFPYYEPYISGNLAEKIKEQMTFGNSDSIALSVGLVASKVKGPDYFRYCLHCYKEEMDVYGEAFWHRSHQLPGVYICSIHKKLLWISDIEFRNKPNKHKFTPLVQSCVENGTEVCIPELYYQQLLFIAEQAYELLNNEFVLIGMKNIKNFYISKLKDRNFITPSRRIRFQELIPNFLNYFPEGLLQFLDSNFDHFDEETWFNKVLRKPKVACHPLRHLLLLLFFEENVLNQLQECKHEVNFFGEAPWPCLNKAANHYKQLIIEDCSISRDSKTGKPVGTFTCIECKFSYSRTGPDISDDDKYNIGRVKNFGPVWENKLHELSMSEEYSIRSISSELGVDSKTTKKYLKNNSKNLTIASTSQDNIIQENRRRFMELRKTYSNYSRTELRKNAPRLCNWLYQNDNEWFTSNLPPLKREYIQKSFVDWGKRDDEYLLLIIREAINLSIEVPLVRVTKTKIYQRLDVQARFENNLDKLPKCKNLLQGIIETVEEFQVRRIRFFGKQFREKNIDYSISTIKRAAGIKETSNQLIRNVILEELKKGVDK